MTDNSGDQTFTYGTDPTITYEVRRVAVGVGTFAGALEFGLQGQDPNGVVVQALTDDHLAKLVLFVGSSSTPFAFSSASHNARTGYNWRNTGLDWSSATTVTVRLRELPDAPTGFEAGVGNAQVALTWDTPASGANITRHEYPLQDGGRELSHDVDADCDERAGRREPGELHGDGADERDRAHVRAAGGERLGGQRGGRRTAR